MKSIHHIAHSGRICIIIPTYNERGNIKRLVSLIQEVLHSSSLTDSASILIVDDDSPDGTGELAEELADIYDNVHVMHRPSKLGLGSAYKQGFSYARKYLKSEIFFQMDADFSHNPKYLNSFLSKLDKGYDVVVGSRWISGGITLGWNVYRYLLSSLANHLAKLMSGIRIMDATSGYRAFSLSALQLIRYSSVKSEGYAFQIEMLFRCQRKNLKLAEIPIVFVSRRKEKTKLDKREILMFLVTCSRLLFERLNLPPN